MKLSKNTETEDLSILSIDYNLSLLDSQGATIDKIVHLLAALPKAVTTKLRCSNEMLTVIGISNAFVIEYSICFIIKRKAAV